MKKMILIAVILLTGCGGDNRFSSKEERQEIAQGRAQDAEKVCIDHVEYLSFPNSYGRTYTAHLQVDGVPYPC